MRIIDADAMIPMMKYATTDSEIGVFPIKIGFDAIVEVINSQPTIEPKRKTGKWIYNSPVTMKCNQCGLVIKDLVIKDWDWHRFKYCPNCGAKMEE